MDLALVLLVSLVGSCFGSIVGTLIFGIRPEKVDPPAPERRAPVYNTQAKAAAYMASQRGARDVPGTWINPKD